MKKYLLIPAFVAILTVHNAVAADPAPAAKKTQDLQKIAVNGTNLEMGMGMAVFPPNAEKPRHKAIGPEVGYVLEGEITVWVDGKPAKIVHAGESYQLAAEDVHITKAGPEGAKVIASWVKVPGKEFNIYMSK